MISPCFEIAHIVESFGWIRFHEATNEVFVSTRMDYFWRKLYLCDMFHQKSLRKKTSPTCSNKIVPLATRHLRPRRQPPPAPRKPPQPPATTALEPEGESPGLHRPLRGGNGGRGEIDGAGDLHVFGWFVFKYFNA